MDMVQWLRKRIFDQTQEAVGAELTGPSPCLAAEPAPTTRRVTAELAAEVLQWQDRPAGGAPPR
eukprot:7307015-Alexandrium_andersonii.AAC.1